MKTGAGPSTPRTNRKSPQPFHLSALQSFRPSAFRLSPRLLFAVLHVPHFSLQAVLRTAPELTGRPVALISADRRKSVVLDLNPAALAAGVELGMTSPQALARCATLTLRPPQPTAETEARQTLLACAFTLSPRIEDTAPGISTIDLRGTPPATQPALTRTALARLATGHLPATAGLARTPWLALLAARATCHVIRDKSAGRPESAPAAVAEECHVLRDNPPDRLLVVDDERGFLSALPLAAAEPSAELAALLADWGVRTLGGLTALPKAEITRRLGAAGLALWERAAGEPVRPLRHVTPPQEFAAAMDFEDEIETLEPLLFLLRRFVDRLALELATARFTATDLALRLDLADGSIHERGFRLPEPTGDPDILFRALHTHLESLHTDAGIRAVALRLTPARPLVRQQGLFDTGLRDPHGFAETLARAVALAGSGQVGTPQPEASHRPDAFTLVPPAATIPPAAPPGVHPPLGLPLRRYRPPRPAHVTLQSGQPAFLDTAGARGDIADRRGPWRASGDWWRLEYWTRLEWDIELADGGLYRLLRTPTGWYLEGEYD